MSDIRFNQWLHQSGTGGVTQLSSGHVGIGTTNPLIPVHSGNNAVLNVGVVTANNIYAGTLNGTLALSDISGITGSFTSDLTVNGPHLDISDKIRHIGDTNTAIRFPANDTISFETGSSEKFRIGSDGQIGLSGANYGTAGQVLTSQGSGAAVQWATPSAPFGGTLDGLNFGGTETTYTSGGTTYKVHSFTSSGFFRVTAAISVDFLIVGGGGGTAAAELSYGATGGGGAGGMVEGTSITIPVGKHTVTVGQGGAASNAYSVAGSGGDSSFNYGTTVTAKGGGGSPDYATTGTAGGSGSGGSEPNGAAGASTQSSQNSGISGIAQFGNAGGAAAGYQSGAGGGGGAGGVGQARSAGGAGGSGRANSITGSSVTYAVGGNGGATGYVNGSPGTNGRGNGASGATSSHPNEGQGAAGGSGIIIIRYVFS